MEKDRYIVSKNLLNLIFPNKLNKSIFAKIDKESIKYITFYTDAEAITKFIANCVNLNEVVIDNNKLYSKISNLVITDITAGVGGNVLNFAKYFKYVNAIEINKLRYEYLKHNISLYGFENVNCYNINSLSLTLTSDLIRQDIVFFDPPWGGSDYKKSENITLLFENLPIEEIITTFLNTDTRIVVSKLPLNYNYNYFYSYLKNYNCKQQIFNKIVIVVIQKKF